MKKCTKIKKDNENIAQKSDFHYPFLLKINIKF